MSKRYTKEFINKCYEQHSKGSSISKIASENNVDRHSLSKALKREFPDFSTNKRNYTDITSKSLDSAFFSVIDTEEKAYWLGFLYADGYLKKDKPVIEVTLKVSDDKHLKKLLDSLSSKNKIYYRNVKLNNKEYSSARVCLYNKHLHTDLISLGCINNKSKVLAYPSFIIDTELERHFIRGFFDGDGNISLETNSTDRISRVRFFSGSESFIKKISERLHELTKVHIDYKWDRTCFALIYNLKKDKIKVLDLMYKDCNIYLDRKYTLYNNYACRFRP